MKKSIGNQSQELRELHMLLFQASKQRHSMQMDGKASLRIWNLIQHNTSCAI
jgi:hypothetical protein